MRASGFNELTKWSNLARLASGNLPKLTIIAPFVAFIILHNEPLQPVLELSKSRHSSPLVDYLALARFDIFYLGLIVIGLGVGLFTIFSPKQITTYRNYEAFLDAKLRTQSSNAVIGSLRLSLERFMASFKGGEARMGLMHTSVGFPRRFQESLAALLENVLPSDELRAHGLVGDDHAPEVARLFQILHERQPDRRDVWQSVFAAMPENSIDVYRLEYLIADYSKPALRKTVFYFLGLGMAVMLVPTVITTFLVLSDLMGAGSAAAGATLSG